MSFRSVALVGLLLGAVGISSARADWGFDVAVLTDQQELTLDAFSPNVALRGLSSVRGLGAEVGVALPWWGLRVGGNVVRHLGDADVVTEAVLAPADVDPLDVTSTFELDATAFSASLECRFAYATWSIQEPQFGVGASFTHVRLGGELVTDGGIASRSALEGASNAWRTYLMASALIVENLGVVVRAGFTLHDGLTVRARELEATGVPAGATLSYEGFYASAGFVLRFP